MAIEDAGAPNSGETSTPAGGGDNTPAPKTSNQPTGEPTGQTPPGGAQASVDSEKRFKGIQADLAKERKQRQEFEARVKQYETELAQERRRIAALAGVNTPSAQDQESEEIRQRFSQLYPHLGQLSPEDIQALREMRSEMESLREIRNRYWTDRADTMVGGIAEAVAKEMGAKTLSERQLQAIQLSYAIRAKSDPEFLARHEAGDKTLAAEFAKEWVEDWFEPVKRRATTQEANRFRPVPRGGDRSVVQTGEKPIDVNNNDEVMDRLVAGFRERGGEFRRR